MRILHTSDWHLGNRLMEQSRHGEFVAFLDWLLGVMDQQGVEALLLCGDVFDSTTPGDRARELYCDFLSRADATGCRAIIITGGNHDSVQQLRVAAPLLQRHHAHVVPSLRAEDAATCLIPLHDASGHEAALVAAVPFLRAPEVARRVSADDAEARRHAYIDGMADCYAAVAEAARGWKAADATRAELPVIAMGHLSVSGVTATASTRPTVIGTLESVSCGIFDPVFDYVALGHIHKPSSHAGGRVRYCGSPLPMGFDEALLPHELLLVDIAPGRCEVSPIPVPRFALYEAATCADKEAVDALLTRLRHEAESHPLPGSDSAPLPIWLTLSYSGGDMGLRALNTCLASRAEECHLRAFRVERAASIVSQAAAGLGEEQLPSLHEYSPQRLFQLRMEEWASALETPPSAEDTAMLAALFDEARHEAESTPGNDA